MDDFPVFSPVPVAPYETIKRWVPTIFIAPLAVFFILSRGEFTLLDNADLVIHEAGHLFFYFLGGFVYTLGGTFMQIFLPSLLVWYFFQDNYRTGVQFSMLWLGQNLINISVYSADAQAQKLHLLGGKNVYHDWAYMLGELNLIRFDAEVGYFFFGLAILVLLLSIFLPIIIRD